MTPSARVAAAIEILDEVARGDAPADAVLKTWSRNNRFAGSKDRRAIRDLVYRDFRKGAQLRWLAHTLGADSGSPRARMILSCELEGAGTAAARFDGSTYGPNALSDEETALVARLHEADRAQPPDWVRAECPEALFAIFSGQWPGTAVDEVLAMNARAPVDLRVNALRATRDDARAALAAAGYETEPTPLSSWGLRGSEHTNFSTMTPFRDGLVDPQDESSQLVAQLVGAAPGMTVVDLCAGAGGKALALAAAMDNSGEIVACDTSGARLSRMEPRCRRLGATIIRPVTVEAGQVPDGLGGWGERVLVDAPCSGSGTWRRSPELRWRTTPDDIAAYAAIQSDLLVTAAEMVQPGGRLVYAVCSVFNQEGRDVAHRFASNDSRFRRVPVSGVLGPDLAGRLGADDDMLLTPHRHGTDGMYAAVFERAG
ncbi:MAG: RsmB/NOP family class I SAM-dependent RNA methyltransferase [Alphaproteobacteria bacterium]|nr:RsmB/NOP family class I SAM-dependent RNA methyltransferase [Alphaproteobacteria bacterium]